MKKKKIKGYSRRKWNMKIAKWLYNMFDDTELFADN